MSGFANPIHPPRTRQVFELLLVTGGSLALAIGSDYPDQMPLQHTATVLLSLFLGSQIWFGRITTRDLRLLGAFMLLHAFAARWIYSYVPYDAWAKTLFGGTLTEQFGFTRNHFDRLVHFGYGLLVTPYVTRTFAKFTTRKPLARYFAVEFVLATSVLYEFFEWALTMVLNPNDAESYNGQQGDLWDAHKDMLAACLGSLVTTLLLALAAFRFDLPRVRIRRLW